MMLIVAVQYHLPANHQNLVRYENAESASNHLILNRDLDVLKSHD